MLDALSVAQQAIQFIQQTIQWKAGKAIPHLEKRILRGHLPQGATLTDYEAIIQQVVVDAEAEVYIYQFGQTSYPTLITTVDQQSWLVMIDEMGIMETAFPPDDPQGYLSDVRFTYIGKLTEVLSE